MTTIYVVTCEDLYVWLMVLGAVVLFTVWVLLLQLLFDPHKDYPHWLKETPTPTRP